MNTIFTTDFNGFTLFKNEPDWISYKENYRPCSCPSPMSYPCFAQSRYVTERDHADWWDISFLYQSEVEEMYEALQELNPKESAPRS